MTDIPQPGSVWVAKDNSKRDVVVVWADELTVVYDFSEFVGVTHRHALELPLFLKWYEPKPHTININGTELPEPMREAPAMGEAYWFTDTIEERGVCKNTWTNHPIALRILKRGQLFRTKEEAQVWLEFEVRQRGGEV